MILLQLISGVMVGMEFQFEQKLLVFDLLIFRVVIFYGDIEKPG